MLKAAGRVSLAAGFLWFAQTSTALPQTPSNSFVVDGVTLGANIQPESEAQHSFICRPSEQFAGFVWCNRTRPEQGRFGPHSSTLSVLQSASGTAVYISQSISPAYFAPGDIDREITRISRDLALPANVMRSDQGSGTGGQVARGILVTWGAIALTPLDEGTMEDLRRGRVIQKGLLFDFLGDARRSARASLPVYSAGGGPGF